MKLGFLGPGDPSDVRSYSGVPHFAMGALNRSGCDMVVIDAGDQAWSPMTLKINNISRRLTGKTVLAAEHLLARKAAAAKANRQIEGAGLDALICLNVDYLIPLLRTDVPIIHNSDATFAAIADYYEDYANMWGLARARANGITQAALDASARCSFPSEWAAESARRDYGISDAKIRIIPYGANLAEAPSSEAAQRGQEGCCRLLLIGGAWERKGGPVAFDIMRALRDAGVDASLTVVGADPGLDHPHVRKIGFLNKQVAEDLALYQSLWAEASFLCMPSKAETFGAIYSEAAAHGLPVIARDTGGVSGCVKHGISGVLLAPDAPVDAFVQSIQEVWNSAAKYDDMVKGARRRFEAELNWDAWARAIVQLAEDAVSEGRA